MIEIEQFHVDLELPSDEVRLVALQSFARLGCDEPFRWGEEGERQLVAIRRTLQLSESGFDGNPANVTLFPEYAIPGVVGAMTIHEAITCDNWPPNTLIIGGIEGLAKGDYEVLCKNLTATTSISNSPRSVPPHQWVNCCVTWIKDVRGDVHTWIQPKLRPAAGELQVQHQDMFYGSTINLFRATYPSKNYPCYFTTFLCFDWIATGPNGSLVDEILNRLNAQGRDNDRSLDLHFVFVLQHNDKPNHPSFQSSTARFLTSSEYPWVVRDHAVVIQVNTAACPSPSPSRSQHYGFSACVFSPKVKFIVPEARPTISRRNRFLHQLVSTSGSHDLVFREMGECIHLFRLRVPKFVDATVGDRTHAIRTAEVYPLAESEDARLPGGPVSADLKWLNDSLDSIEHLSHGVMDGRPLMAAAQRLEKQLDLQLRRVRSLGAATQFINCAVCNTARRSSSRTMERTNDPDLWEDSEVAAFQHILHSLTAVGISFAVDVDEATPHAILTQKDAGPVRVLAIRGDSHEDCRIHFDSLPKHLNDPVLVIARDHDNSTPRPEEFTKLLDSDPGHGLQFLDYQRLMTFCRDAQDETSLHRDLNEFIPRERRII